jgi:hypothetical protein
MKTSKLALLFAGVLLTALVCFPVRGDAGVNVGIGINVPAFTFGAPPQLIVIPGTYAYFAPDAGIDIIFYGGYWYRPYEGRWFRARGYNGPWGHISTERVPRSLIGLRPDFRRTYRSYPRIEYRDYHKNWRSWEKNRHWEKDERWREGLRNDRPDRHDRRHR